MKKQLICLLICLSCIPNLSASCQSAGRDSVSVNDGPYIFLVNDTLKVMRIENSLLTENYFPPRNLSEIKISSDQSSDYRELMKVFSLKPEYCQNYKRVDSIAAISDVHGQYKIYLNQLIANGIIDKNLNWKFGKGHLVVLGDVFDRGGMVTEILWHLFGLEKQAVKAGGMVHYILGNHEVMVIDQDLRFINEKYREVEAISGINYSDLYSENSVLGKWLRSRPVMITINDIIFVHGGISPELVQRNLKIDQVNRLFYEEFAGKELQAAEGNEQLSFINGNNGPLWYRGYFADTTFTESKLDSILGYYKKEHIIVGHTTHKEIQILFNNKVFGIDNGIVYGQPGTLLLYKKGYFYKCSINGVRTKL